MKKFATVVIVLAILINSVSVLAIDLCSYCDSPGYLMCQHDSIGYSDCPYCSALPPPILLVVL